MSSYIGQLRQIINAINTDGSADRADKLLASILDTVLSIHNDMKYPEGNPIRI